MAKKSRKTNKAEASNNKQGYPESNGVSEAESKGIPIDGDQEAEDLEVELEQEPLSEIDQLRVEIAKTQAELDEAKDLNLRLNADFVNFRKRKDKEVADVIRYANQDLLVKILPILDNFDRTLKAIEETDNLAAIKEGIEGVSRNMRNILTRIGLEPIDTTGAEFDSEIHEAVTAIPVQDEDQKGKVVDEIEKGYKLNDRIIRFSKVVVGE
jgi:molecular chaperone GrpE